MRPRSTLLLVPLALAITVASAVPAAASFPGANGRIVFVTRGTWLERDIFSIQPDGSARTRLTFDARSGEPAWSPDGARMAFVRPGRIAELVVADADAAGAVTVLSERDLPDGLSPADDVAWTADGLRLVVRMNRGDTSAGDLFFVDADGSNLTQLTPRARFAMDPAVSNDGSTIAYSERDGQGNFRLMLVDIDGTDRRVLGTGGGRLASALTPDWAPDDATIVFARWDGEQIDLFTIEPDGDALTRLTDSSSRWEGNPVYSPDGTLIAYDRGGLSWRPTDLWTMAAGGGSATRLTHTPERSEDSPAWQPLVPG